MGKRREEGESKFKSKKGETISHAENEHHAYQTPCKTRLIISTSFTTSRFDEEWSQSSQPS
jgi:hypothetical protein